LNWGIEVLQTSALPLGYVAIKQRTMLLQADRRSKNMCESLSSKHSAELPTKYKMERKTRFELATLALARRCSTAELLPLKWCLRTESNCRHEDFQSSALPTELPRQMQLSINAHLRCCSCDPLLNVLPRTPPLRFSSRSVQNAFSLSTTN